MSAILLKIVYSLFLKITATKPVDKDQNVQENESVTVRKSMTKNKPGVVGSEQTEPESRSTIACAHVLRKSKFRPLQKYL